MCYLLLAFWIYLQTWYSALQDDKLWKTSLHLPRTLLVTDGRTLCSIDYSISPFYPVCHSLYPEELPSSDLSCMTSHRCSASSLGSTLTEIAQLSKQEESEATDAEVTREDQEKINVFSRLHNRTKVLEEELKAKNVSRLLFLISDFFNSCHFFGGYLRAWENLHSNVANFCYCVF